VTHEAFTDALQAWLDAYVAGVLAELRAAAAERVALDFDVSREREGERTGAAAPARRSRRVRTVDSTSTTRTMEAGRSPSDLDDTVAAAGPIAPPRDVPGLSGSPATASSPSWCAVCRAPHRPQPAPVRAVAPVVRLTVDARSLRAREVIDR